MDFGKLKSMGEQAMNSGSQSGGQSMDFNKLKSMGEQAMNSGSQSGGAGGQSMDFNSMKAMGEQYMASNTDTTAPAADAAAADATAPAAAAEGSAAASASAGTQDYGDKAFAFIAQKTGKNIDPATQEKITDGVRGAYEKATGKKVDPKWSN